MLHDIVTVAGPASCDPAPSSSPLSGEIHRTKCPAPAVGVELISFHPIASRTRSPLADGTLTVGLAPLPEFGAAASFGVVWSTPVYAAIPTVTVTELGETIDRKS